MRVRILPHLAWSLSFALGGCTAPAPPAPPPAVAELDPEAFQGSWAWGHLEALAEIGPREAVSDGSARARAYISGELEALGLEVIEQGVSFERSNGESVTLKNIVAAVPGESTDLFLVVAPYDTRGFEGFENLGINDGSSGVAVNLELARLIAATPLPYTTWFVFLEGEQEVRGGTASLHLGSRGLVGLLKERNALEQVRLALIVNRVCDPDLNIARDLGSHRVYREEFFGTAKKLGFEAAFDRTAGFESPDEGQTALASGGLSRVVVLADTSFGGSEPPGPYADTADDDLAHCAATSLETVGQVAFASLQVISRRLQRIDRFADSPIAETEVLRLEHLRQTEAAAESTAEPEFESEAVDRTLDPDAQVAPEGAAPAEDAATTAGESAAAGQSSGAATAPAVAPAEAP